MIHRQKRTPHWVLVALAAVPPLFVLAADPSAPEAAENTLTEYSVTIQSTSTRVESASTATTDHAFTIQAYEVAVKKHPRRCIALVLGDLDESGDLPVGAIELNGAPTVELEHPVGRVLSRCIVPVLEPEVPRKRIEDLASGEETIDVPQLLVQRVPVRYGTSKREGEQPAIAYVVELEGAGYTSRIGSIETKLNRFTRQIEFDPAGLRVVRLHASHALERSTNSGKDATKETHTVEVREMSRRALTDKEATQVTQEYEYLAPVLNALMPGADHDLRRSNEARKVEERLKSHSKRFAGALLGSALLPLERAYKSVRERLALPEDPEEVAQLMLGKPAPDFVLEALDGSRVTLEDFKGRPVLLNFWALL